MAKDVAKSLMTAAACVKCNIIWIHLKTPKLAHSVPMTAITGARLVENKILSN